MNPITQFSYTSSIVSYLPKQRVDMFFGKRRKAQFEEKVFDGDQEVASISLDGSGRSVNGRSFWGVNLLGGNLRGRELTVRGRKVRVARDKDGNEYIEFQS